MNDAPRRTVRDWLLIAAICVSGGLLSFAGFAAANLVEGWGEPNLHFFIREIDAALMVLLLLPPVLALMDRLVVCRENWWWTVPVHVAASMVVGILHTLLMWSSRKLIWMAFDLGRYEYELNGARFLMEYSKQAVLYLGVYLVVAFFRHQRRRRTDELRLARLRQQLSEARLEGLRAQLSPHFIFNTLNMIAAKVHDDPELADAMIGRLSDFLRMTLQDTGRPEVTLERELDYVDAYLAIMRARFGERLDATVDAPEELRGAAVPHLVLQPLVENAIKHGGERQGGAVVRIAATMRDDLLCLRVEDNGPGPAAHENAPQGIGLANTRQRLREIHGDRARLALAGTADGCRVELCFPWRELPDGEDDENE